MMHLPNYPHYPPKLQGLGIVLTSQSCLAWGLEANQPKKKNVKIKGVGWRWFISSTVNLGIPITVIKRVPSRIFVGELCELQLHLRKKMPVVWQCRIWCHDLNLMSPSIHHSFNHKLSMLGFPSIFKGIKRDQKISLWSKGPLEAGVQMANILTKRYQIGHTAIHRQVFTSHPKI